MLLIDSDDDIALTPIGIRELSYDCDIIKEQWLREYRPPSLFHAVLKISNISWDTSIADIQNLLLPRQINSAQVHIPIDRTTGKTLSDLYIELADMADVLHVVFSLNRCLLKGRALFMTPCSYDELYRVHFQSEPIFISAAEGLRLVSICRNFKTFYSRKCAQRPFEHLISVLRLIPWYKLEDEHISILYHTVHGAICALRYHLAHRRSTKSPELDSQLLQRLLDSALAFPLFTNAQALILKNEAGICADEIVTDEDMVTNIADEM